VINRDSRDCSHAMGNLEVECQSMKTRGCTNNPWRSFLR
jgi:hypothetical protein